MIAAGLLASGVAAETSTASGSKARVITPCRPSRPIGVFNLQARGVSCAIAMSIPQSHTVTRHVISSHKFTWMTAAGWECISVTFPSPYGEDDQGAIIDCRRGAQEVRWSNSSKIEPRSLSQ